ncbi:peptidase U32 family protein [Brevibacillus daliensis]|uniref:peptidase U32 family protein n=1 Tax=Brevibacillus daliensis TaxID=2892995 RepID=UPI001E520AA3|nr:U32 family peptidase [Brevibacillus daliensis]
MSTILTPNQTGFQPVVSKPELLSPAGNLEKLQFAIRYGADAVYIGGQVYSLRANADNFSYDEMREGVKFAHERGAKVFVATNIIAHNEDLGGMAEYYQELQNIGIDAVIVADPALIQACKKAAPKIEVHLSTQASTTNWRSVQFWKDEGISRVVLAREVSMKEIYDIKSHVDVEIEAFIHGAMCIAYSGRCVLSNHMAMRDSNRGGCAQSCRWKYDLFEDGYNFEEAENQLGKALYKEGEEQYTMSPKDLSMLPYIADMIEAGVDSLKVEGRMKSIHYVATVSRAYRRAIDSYYEDPKNFKIKQEWIDEVYKAAPRTLSTGFFYGSPSTEEQIFGEPNHPIPYDFAGLVMDYDPDTQIALVQVRNHFKVGANVEFFGPDTFFAQKVEKIWHHVTDEEMQAARHPMELVKIKVDQPVKPYDMMRKEL